MSFSRILYMICVNGGYLVSENFNNIDRKTWREIKETLQWPPVENQLVVYTQPPDPRAVVLFFVNICYHLAFFYYLGLAMPMA